MAPVPDLRAPSCGDKTTVYGHNIYGIYDYNVDNTEIYILKKKKKNLIRK